MSERRPWESAARGSRILLAGSVAAKALRLATDVLLGRVLGPAAFGVVAAALSFVYILTRVAQLGVDRGVLRFVSAHGPTGADGASRTLTRRALAVPLAGGVALVAVVALARVPLTRMLFGDATSPWILVLFAVGVPLGGFLTVLQSAARASRRYGADTLVGEVIRNAGVLALTAVLLLAGWRLGGAAVGFAGGLLVSAVLGWRIYTRGAGGGQATVVPPGPAVAPEGMRALLRVSVPLAFATSAGLLVNELDKPMLAALRSPTEAGLYNAAFRLARQVNLVLPALVASLSPWVAPLIAEGRLDDLRDLYRRTNRWGLAAAASAAITCALFSRELLGLFGPGFAGARTTLTLVALGQTAIAASAGAAMILQFSGRERVELRVQALALSLNVALNLALIPRFGAAGAAGATLAVHGTAAAVRLAAARRVIGALPWDRGTARMLLGALVSAAGAAALGHAGRALGAPGPAVVAAASAGALLGWIAFAARGGIDPGDSVLLRRVPGFGGPARAPMQDGGDGPRAGRGRRHGGPMRLLFFSAYPGYSGSHRMAMEVAVACRDAGHHVICAAPADMEFLERGAGYGLATRVVAAPDELLEFGKTLLRRSRLSKLRLLASRILPYNLRVLRLLRAERIDLVYAAQERAVVQVGVAARLARVPLVWHLQGGLRTEQRWVHRLSAWLASRIVCCSDAVAGTAADAFGGRTRTPVRVIRYGIPDRPPPGAGPGDDVREPVQVLFAGNVVPEKGVHHLLRAFAAVAGADGAPARLGIAGPTLDGGYLELVRSTIAELGLEDRVDVLGYREDLPALIEAADVVVCPSIERETLRSRFGTWEVDWKEGFCLVALEGMRAGKPVVASDSYGLREVVVDGETGYRVAPGDVEALASAIRRLAGEPETRRRLGEAGRRRFEETFRLSEMTRRFLEELEEARAG